MKSVAIIKRHKRSETETMLGRDVNPYETIVLKGFNHTAASICKRGDDHVCFMVEYRGVVPMNVKERFDTHVVLADKDGNTYGVVFDNA
jgi:hypothetical protein